MGTGVLDAVCVPFERLLISMCSFVPMCAAAGEGIRMKFGIWVYTEELSTIVQPRVLLRA